MNKTLCSFLLFACAVSPAATVTYGALVDPAPDAFCTDVAHPVCIKLTQISFTGLSTAPNGVTVEDGLTTIYSFSNLNVTVDPSGTTFSGSITPDEAFSITNAENTDLQRGLFQLDVVANAVGVSDFEGDSSSTTVLAGTPLSALTTPEPATSALLLTGIALAWGRGKRCWRSAKRTS